MLAWLRLIPAIASIFGYLKDLGNWISSLMLKKKIEEKQEAIHEAVQEIQKANEVEDDQARLLAKAQALEKLEKLANPGAHPIKPDSH